MGTVYWIGIKIQCSMQNHCFKYIKSKELISFKYCNCRGSGYTARVQINQMWIQSRARLLWTILFDSGHLQHERKRPDIKRKHMKIDSEVVGGTKQASSCSTPVFRETPAPIVEQWDCYITVVINFQ